MTMNVKVPTAKYITWQIPKFDLLMKHSYLITSSSFSLFGAEDKWYLLIVSNYTTDAAKKFILMTLVKETSPVERRVGFNIGITYIDGKDVKLGERNEIFKLGDSYGICLIEQSKLENTTDALAPDKTLTVFCTAAIVDKPALFPSMEAATRITVTTASIVPETSSSERNLTSISPTPLSVKTMEIASKTTTAEGVTTLIGNLKDLYISKRCADVKITVKGTEFLAHSHILISRSKVFSSMLSIDMLEKNSGVIEITDCDPTSFDDFLLFMYTGNLEVVSARNATSLYETAEKYDLKDLKEECYKCMSINLQ